MVMYGFRANYCVTRPRNSSARRRRASNQRQGGGGGNAWGMINLGGFRASFPRPSLPFRLGADTRLPQNLSVYPVVKLDVPIIPFQATIAAGATSLSVAIDPNAVFAFSTRFASLFREYAILGARLELRPQNISPAGGVCAAFLDEQVAAAPTGPQAVNRPRLDMTLAPLTVPKAYHLDWTPRDLLDLDYVSTATTFTPVWLKIYTDTPNFFTPASTTGQILVTGTIAFQFRGYV